MSLNESFMNRWKVAGEFESPKNITVGSNSPFGVMNAAFHSSPSLIRKGERVGVFNGVLIDVSVVLARSDPFVLLSNIEEG